MKLKSFFDKAKKTVDDRGGVQALKEDAEELRDVAKGKGSLADKAKWRRGGDQGSGSARRAATGPVRA